LQEEFEAPFFEEELDAQDDIIIANVMIRKKDLTSRI